MDMTNLTIRGDLLKLEVEVSDDVGFQVIDIARRDGESTESNGFQIDVESTNLSFNESIDAGTAQDVFEYVTDHHRNASETTGDLETLVNKLTKRQRAFVSVLAEHGGRVLSTPLRGRVKEVYGIEMKARGLGGSIQGLHTKSNDLLGERLTDAHWVDDEYEYEYWIQEQYLEPLRELLDQA